MEEQRTTSSRGITADPVDGNLGQSTEENPELKSGTMPPWTVGELPEPPNIKRGVLALLGPGLMMAGGAIGGGEWLLGPAVTAKYGAIVMWLAGASILLQVAYNIEVMRYAMYCGESIFVGYMRLLPGPRFWTAVYLFVDFFGVWPYLAANAAVPLAAAILGHLPKTPEEMMLRNWLAYAIFAGCFIPLIFGGKIYNVLARIMVVKVFLVLGYLLFLGVVYVSPGTWAEIFGGFVFIGKEADGSWGFGMLPSGPGTPPIDWALLGAFAAIAGQGGMTNSQFSSYVRDKGWGMGKHVGAIGSIVGGRNVRLAHTGKIFPTTQEAVAKFRGWLKLIYRDQWMIWFVGCILGVAIPALISLQFLRGMEVSGDEVAAKTAEALRARTGHQAFWFMTLLCGFLVLAPNQVQAADGLIRRWTELLWTGSRKLHRLEDNKVRFVYFTLLATYLCWGMLILVWTGDKPLTIAKASGVIMNFALGFTALHTLAVNLILLPKPLRPGWIGRIGITACGVFFITIAGLALPKVLRELKIPQMLTQLWNWLGG